MIGEVRQQCAGHQPFVGLEKAIGWLFILRTGVPFSSPPTHTLLSFVASANQRQLAQCSGYCGDLVTEFCASYGFLGDSISKSREHRVSAVGCTANHP